MVARTYNMLMAVASMASMLYLVGAPYKPK